MSSSVLSDFVLGDSLLGVPGDEALPPPPPLPPSGTVLSKSRRRVRLPTVAWTIDGTSVPMTAWTCNAVANGGFDRMSGLIPESVLWANPSRFVQEAPIYATVGAEQFVWHGHLMGDPVVNQGLAKIEAVGFKDRVEEAAGRLLYQSRDYKLLANGGDPPFNFTPANENIEAQVRDASLWWKITNEAHTSGDMHPLAAWFVGIPTGIRRYAFTIRKDANDSKYDIRVQSFTGPSGARTVLTDHGLGGAAATDIDVTVSTDPEDGISFGVRCNTNDTPAANNRVRIVDLRINSIALTDEFLTSDVAKDIGLRVNYDTSGVQASGLNAMPFDLVSGSWAQSGLDYVASLDDWRWCVFEDRGQGPLLDYGPWETRTWHVQRGQNAAPDLRPLPVYDQVVVRYVSANGVPQQASAAASPDPLPAGSRIWYEDLSDPQPDDTLATTVAQTLIERLSVPRYTGSVDIVGARLDSGLGNAYSVRPGDMVDVSDWAPSKNLVQRILEVEYRPDGVRLGVEMPVTSAGIVATYDLEQLRRKKGS